MNTLSSPPTVAGEPFVDAREAAYTMNLPMYYLTHAKQRDLLALPFYRIGRSVRFKLSELAEWQRVQGGITPADTAAGSEVPDA
jgi:hypothetical protein